MCAGTWTGNSFVEVSKGQIMSREVPRLERRIRTAVTRGLLLIDGVALVMDIAQLHGPIRFVVSLVFSVVVPGWSIVGFARIRDLAWLVALTMATSFALEIIIGEIVLSSWWHLQILEVILAVVCGALLVEQLRRQGDEAKVAAP